MKAGSAARYVVRRSIVCLPHCRMTDLANEAYSAPHAGSRPCIPAQMEAPVHQQGKKEIHG